MESRAILEKLRDWFGQVISMIRRITRILLIAIGCVLLFVLLLTGFMFWFSTPPSDASLERRFYKHRADLQQIVKMAEQDAQMERIATDFTRNADWDTEPLKQRGISDQRWNLYREIFRRADVPTGTWKDKNSNDILIGVWAFGLAIAAKTVGYVHCGKPSAGIVNLYRPCLERKESGKINEKDDFIRYKQIEPDWYIYEYDY